MRAVPCSGYVRRRQRLYAFLHIRAVGSERFGCSPSSLAWRMDSRAIHILVQDSSEEEPMSSAPPSGDEFPIQDDETLSELVRTPSRTSGDLQQHADLEDDLEPVPDFEESAPTNREMLAELLQRVRRIEEHLGIHES